ncbi:MAG: restriction endonuclease subunit S [Lachnospiraceae bacterium]|nr:restriction endonuclease subunit S [Lachnospiraceae bacterium]
MANIPNIRFKGFDDGWELRKLGDYLEVSKEKNRDEIYGKEDVLSVSGDYGIVNQMEFQGRSFAGDSVANYGVVETGDVVYTKSPLKSNPYGIIKANKGKSGIVSTLYAVYKPKENTDSEFVQIYFEQHARMNNYMHPLVNKGAKNDMKVSSENALKGEICFPSKAEQTKISEYFSNLDHLITLHQRKCDEVKLLKRFMLFKMFPKSGELIPEIRFAEFAGDWEQRKLGEMLSLLRDGTHGTHADAKEGPLLLSAKNIKAGTINWDETDRRISQEDYDKIHSTFNLIEGDVLLTIVGSIGETAIVKELQGITFQRSVAFLRPNKSILSQFLYSEIQTSRFKKELDSRKSASAQPGIYLGDLAEIPVVFSTNIDEQEKIGKYFSHLDHLITLHRHKCNQLKEVKRFMLQNMFPQKG